MNTPHETAYRVLVREEDRVRSGLALHAVAASTGASVSEMTARTQRPGSLACRARRLAVYLSHVAFGWPLERTAHAFGLNRTTVSAACRWVEDARDRPALDHLLVRLEASLREWVETPDQGRIREWLA